MDVKTIAFKIGLSDNVKVIRKAQELQRLSNVHFDSSSFGVGEVCKAVLCLELACTLLNVSFERHKAVPLSSMSEKAYVRSLAILQNALGLRKELDVRELAIQFGCVRLIGSVHKVLELYKKRFVAALPECRRCSADFGRPVFTAVAFYLCARKQKLKVDKSRVVEICGTSDSEFGTVATSMLDLCFDVVGIEKEKKDPASIKCNRELLDVLPTKRKHEEHEDTDSDSECVDNEDGLEVPGLKSSNKLSKAAYEEWRSSVMASRAAIDAVSGSLKRAKQIPLSFSKQSVKPVKSAGTS